MLHASRASLLALRHASRAPVLVSPIALCSTKPQSKPFPWFKAGFACGAVALGTWALLGGGSEQYAAPPASPSPQAVAQHQQWQQQQRQQGDQQTSTSQPQPQAPAHAVHEDDSDEEDEGVQAPWVMDKDLRVGLHRRMVAEHRLRAYIDKTYTHVKQMEDWARMRYPGEEGAKWFQAQLEALEPEVDHTSQVITFGVQEPGARQAYLQQYGGIKWSDAALKLTKSLGPVLLVGRGGNGEQKWLQALQQVGADVSTLPVKALQPTATGQSQGQVRQVDEKAVRKHSRRALLLLHPQPDDMALRLLNEYVGNTLVYVGEARGGANANEAFFDALRANWVCERVEQLEPFPECYEKMYVLRRQGTQGGGKSWWRLW